MSKGSKYDEGKPPLGQIIKGIQPSYNEVLEILIQGADVHGLNNWQKVEAVRFEDALFRHINSYLNGELIDKESGKSHLSHIVCNCLFLRWMELND